MFFVFGIDTREKALEYARQLVCPCCGRLGRVEVFMRYTCFSLFFIPLFQWGKRYFARAVCCGEVCELEEALGKRIERGEPAELTAADLRFTSRRPQGKRCPRCGFESREDYLYCPNCGARLP